MAKTPRTLVWSAIWDKARQNSGIEHAVIRAGSAGSVLVAFDEQGKPFRLFYTLMWDDQWRIRQAQFIVRTDSGEKMLHLYSDGAGTWRDQSGSKLTQLQGCTDLDIWPTPLTNTFPIRRLELEPGEREEIQVAFVTAPELRIKSTRQAYTRLEQQLYLFEGLDTGFQAKLPVDSEGLVLDYPELFRRLF